MKIENNTAAGTQSLLLNTAKKVLKPLVRLLLKHGVGYPMLIEELKVLFVEVADQEFKLPGKSQTDSRITILTGVHRKDVKRIRESDTRTQSSHKANLGAQVVAKWISDARYLDSSNQPLPLPRSSVVDQPVSFDQLVESFSKDIRPKVLLDEWINAGIVSVNEHQMVKLNTEAFVPKGNTNQALEFLGMNLHDHMSAAVHNVQATDPPFFERCAFDEKLDLNQVREVEEFVRTQGMDFLKSVNKKNIAVRQEREAATGNYRINTGIYFYFEQQPEPSENRTDG